MALLIDGHNLIGAGVFDDIALADEDDEAKLVARLKVWRSRYRGKITVVFDRGIPGGRDRTLSGGGVEVVFAATPVEADDLIQRRLSRRPRNLELVSNDAKLVAVAKSHGVPTLSGTELVERFTFAYAEAEQEEPGQESDVNLSAEEVQEWMKVFAAQPKRRRRRPPLRRPRKRRK
jgi:predicted RNA-binding protein with PIN domain